MQNKSTKETGTCGMKVNNTLLWQRWKENEYLQLADEVLETPELITDRVTATDESGRLTKKR